MKSEKEYLLTLTGQELFDIYLSRHDEYSSILLTAYVEIREDLFPLLEKAERLGKKVTIIQDMVSGVFDPPITVTLE